MQKAIIHPVVPPLGTAILVIALMTATCLRNPVYRSEIMLWESTVRSTPGKQRTHHNYACALAKEGRYGEALAAIDGALRLENDGSVLLHYLFIEQGNANYRLGRREEALESWRRALALSPGNAEIMTNMAVAFLELGRFEEARTHARSALNVSRPLAETFEVLGELALRRKDFDDASSYFAAAIRKRPGVQSLYLNAALAREGAGDYREAYAYLEKYTALGEAEGDRKNIDALRHRLRQKIALQGEK